jgi:uncharacterized DUF497 family protein
MDFEWDVAKNRINIAKHGIDFRDAIRAFDGPVLVEEDGDYGYGEVRDRSIGRMDGLVVIVIIHTDRAGKVRIISARKATPHERRKFEAAFFPSAFR